MTIHGRKQPKNWFQTIYGLIFNNLYFGSKQPIFGGQDEKCENKKKIKAKNKKQTNKLKTIQGDKRKKIE